MYILLIAVLSAAFCIGLAYPLWLFATESAHSFTVFTIILALLTFIFLFIRKFIQNLKNCTSRENRRNFILRSVFTLLIILTIVYTLCFSVKQVLAESRITALLILISGIILIIAFKKLRARFSDV